MSAPDASSATSSDSTLPTYDPDRIWFYLDRAGNQRGPITPLDIADLLLEREINSSTFGWRHGLSEWQALSLMPELKGIFATAFDAPDETPATQQQKGKQQQQAKATNSNSSTAASAAASAPHDPLAIWFYLDKNRQSCGPVREEEILKLYGLMQLNDTSLVYCANPTVVTSTAASSSSAIPATAAASTWTRLSETPTFASHLGPDLLTRYTAERDAQAAADAKKQQQKKRKREQRKTTATNDKWRGGGVNNTVVYMTGLPPTIDATSLYEFAKRGGIILEDENGERRMKIYRDADGKPKGDALITYAMPDSVDLAITLLDQAPFPQPVPKKGETQKQYLVTVQRAEFQPKEGREKKNDNNGNTTAASAASASTALTATSASTTALTVSAASNKRQKQHAGALTASEIARHRLKESLSWDDAPVVSNKLKIVILRPLFTLEEVAAHEDGEEAFYEELREEVTQEIEDRFGGGEAGRQQRGNRGVLEKLTIFKNNPDGVIAAKFRDATHAAECKKFMHGRFFGGAQLSAVFYDGTTNYMVEKNAAESQAEEEKRLKEFGDWIEGGGEE